MTAEAGRMSLRPRPGLQRSQPPAIQAKVRAKPLAMTAVTFLRLAARLGSCLWLCQPVIRVPKPEPTAEDD